MRAEHVWRNHGAALLTLVHQQHTGVNLGVGLSRLWLALLAGTPPEREGRGRHQRKKLGWLQAPCRRLI